MFPAASNIFRNRHAPCPRPDAGIHREVAVYSTSVNVELLPSLSLSASSELPLPRGRPFGSADEGNDSFQLVRMVCARCRANVSARKLFPLLLDTVCARSPLRGRTSQRKLFSLNEPTLSYNWPCAPRHRHLIIRRGHTSYPARAPALLLAIPRSSKVRRPQ